MNSFDIHSFLFEKVNAINIKFRWENMNWNFFLSPVPRFNRYYVEFFYFIIRDGNAASGNTIAMDVNGASGMIFVA